MSEGTVSAQVLKTQLDKEIKLYKQYIEILAEEKAGITKFNSETVEASTQKREALYAEIKEAAVKRLEMLRDLAGPEKKRLTAVINEKFQGREAKELLARAETLKSLSEQLKKESREFGQIVNFGLNVVNGTLSIFMSATQNVTKSYGKSGLIKESFNPQGTRHSGVIKEA